MEVVDSKLLKFLSFRKNTIAFNFSNIFILRCRRTGKVVASNKNIGRNRFLWMVIPTSDFLEL